MSRAAASLLLRAVGKRLVSCRHGLAQLAKRLGRRVVSTTKERSWRPASLTGRRGEKQARRFLRAHRYRILATNLRSRLGEIDLLALSPDQAMLVLVEVKARATTGVPPEAAMTARKRRKLTTLARQLLRRPELASRPMRFDVVTVHWTGDRKPTIRHYVNAFDAAG